MKMLLKQPCPVLVRLSPGLRGQFDFPDEQPGVHTFRPGPRDPKRMTELKY